MVACRFILLSFDVSDYRKHPEGWRIQFKMKSNSIKTYDKFSSLRVEMTINNPGAFKVYKDVQHKDGTISKQWVPMGKSISNLYRYAEISKAANRRFLDSMQHIVPAKTIEKEINGICCRNKVDGRSYSGYNVWSEDTFRLFETISDGRYLIRDFTNREIRHSIGRANPNSARVKGQTSREFSRLRSHGLI